MLHAHHMQRRDEGGKIVRLEQNPTPGRNGEEVGMLDAETAAIARMDGKRAKRHRLQVSPDLHEWIHHRSGWTWGKKLATRK